MTPDWKVRVRRTVESTAIASILGCAVASLLGLLGSWWWVFDLFANFRVQLLTALLVPLVVLAALKRWRWTATAVVFAIAHAASIAPLYWSSPAPVLEGSVPLQIMAWNVNFQNQDPERVASVIADADTDIVAVIEATPAVIAEIKRRLPSYDVIAEPRLDAYGMAVFTRGSFDGARLIESSRFAVPAIEVTFDHAGERFAMLAIHTLPPVNAEQSRDRDRLLDDAARWARDQSGHAIVLGDFNATPWSAAFRRFKQRSGLVSSQRGFGLQTSWPGFFWPLAITIDHLFHAPSLTTVSRRVGAFHGSDHRPLYVSLALRAL